MATKVSLILPTFRRANLLDLTLYSIQEQKIDFDLEVVVVNDGIEDNTEDVCKKYNKLNVKYIFSGQRNTDTDKRRVAGFALNIGVKQSVGDILILSCAEIFHLNNCLSQIVTPLLTTRGILTTPNTIYFDDWGGYTDKISQLVHSGEPIHYNNYLNGEELKRRDSVYAIRMPYLMGMWREEYVSIGGYDEDFTGYAADDNDFIGRLLTNGCYYHYVNAVPVHLYHGISCDALFHPENPAWAYNYKLFQDRKGMIVRNQNKEWGKI